MKKLLVLTLSLASIAFVATSAEAKTTESAKSSLETTITANTAAPQIIQIRPGRRFNRRMRIVTRTRTVRVGGRLYRETYQTRYMGNGRVVTRIISRIRIR